MKTNSRVSSYRRVPRMPSFSSRFESDASLPAGRFECRDRQVIRGMLRTVTNFHRPHFTVWSTCRTTRLRVELSDILNRSRPVLRDIHSLRGVLLSQTTTL
jgi:hypothetical protein